MAGNVWEWVNDWYSATYYSSLPSPSSNPPGPTSGDDKIVRGGGWHGDVYTLRAAYRFFIDPVEISTEVGFRCAAAPGN
jgi:formylglycine-generating enzyme required for sulfatase activity